MAWCETWSPSLTHQGKTLHQRGKTSGSMPHFHPFPWDPPQGRPPFTVFAPQHDAPPAVVRSRHPPPGRRITCPSCRDPPGDLEDFQHIPTFTWTDCRGDHGNRRLEPWIFIWIYPPTPPKKKSSCRCFNGPSRGNMWF